MLDYVATLAWAISGAFAAARRGYDVAGIFAIALVTATGGGLLRDGIFLQDGPPAVVRTPLYIALVVLAAGVGVLLGRGVLSTRAYARIVAVVDALGLGAYTVVGVALAERAGLDVLGAALVGVVNAVGGGVLRDVLMREEPEIFRPGALYALASLAGAALLFGLTHLLDATRFVAAWATIAFVFALRMVSLFYGPRTRALGRLVDPPPRQPPGQVRAHDEATDSGSSRT